MASALKFLVAASLAIQASAGPSAPQTIKINVGQNNLTFTPDNVQANKGDLLEFHFFPRNHSVVQGDLSNPCQPAKGGFFSGFFPTTAENATVFTVKVATTDPIVFYCSQNTATHCKSGMSGIINAASHSQLRAYRDAAKNVASASSPPKPAGGEFSVQSVGSTKPSGSGSSSPSASSTGVSAPSNTATTGTGSGSGATTGEGVGSGAGAASGTASGSAAGSGTTGVVPSAAGTVKAGFGGLVGIIVFALTWL